MDRSLLLCLMTDPSRYSSDSSSVRNSVSSFATDEEKQAFSSEPIWHDWADAKSAFLDALAECDIPNGPAGNRLRDEAAHIRFLIDSVDEDDEKRLLSTDLLITDYWSLSHLFHELLRNSLSRNHVTLAEDALGPWSGCQLYRNFHPAVCGVQFPADFTMLKPFPWADQAFLNRCLQFAILNYIRFPRFYRSPLQFIKLFSEWNKYVKPLLDPRADFKGHALYGQVKLLVEEQSRTEIQHDGRVAIATERYPLKASIHRPLRAIPPVDWFTPDLRDLSPQEIVPIFAPAEMDVFMLLIGRALLGPSGTVPVGYSDPIKHTSRIAGVIKGTPGSGKSELLSLIRDTVRSYGYVVRMFESLDAQFGLGEAAIADFAMRDDTAASDFLKLSASSNFKSFVTSMPIKAEKKFKDAVVMKPRGVIIVAMNDWDVNSSYGTDSGNRSRLRILETLTPSQRDQQLENIHDGHVWKGLTALTPNAVVTHLASKLNVSPEAVMGRFFRHCLDRFVQAIPNLEEIDKRLSCQLTTTIPASPNRGLIKALRLSLRLTDVSDTCTITSQNLKLAIKALCALMLDCRTGPILDAIKADWERSYRDPYHCWTAFKDFPYPSVIRAYDIAEASTGTTLRGRKPSLDEFVKEVLTGFSTRRGILANPSPANFYEDWCSAATISEVDSLYPALKGLIPPNLFVPYPDDQTRYKGWFNPGLTPSQIRAARASAQENLHDD